MLSAWPVRRPPDWLARVNPPQSAAEEEQALRLNLSRGRPFGDADRRAAQGANSDNLRDQADRFRHS